MLKRRNLLYVGNKLSGKGVTATTIETLGPLLESEGIQVFTASSCKIKVLRLIDMLLKTLLKAKKVSAVLIDTYSTQNFYYAVAVAHLCRILKTPYIPILHGGNLPDRLRSHPQLCKRLFNGAKINVAPSKYLLEAFKEHGYTNVTFIPNSIEINNYPFLKRSDVKPKLLWVRSFAEIYNPMLAIDVVKQLHVKGVEVSLTMIGPEKDGSQKRCMFEAEEHDLPITFTGRLDKKEWIAVSKDHDIFINTTNFDNMPVSLIEASALGMPIVSTNVGGIPYLIEDKVSGLLIPPNNANSFVDAINKLTGDPTLVSSCTDAARSNVERFDWQKVKQKWLNLIP